MLFTDKQHFRELSNRLGRFRDDYRWKVIWPSAGGEACLFEPPIGERSMRDAPHRSNFRISSRFARSISGEKWGWQTGIHSGGPADLAEGQMAKTNTLFKNAYNRCLQMLEPDMNLPSEPEIALRLGIGRSTAHAILERLENSGIIEWQKQKKRVLRLPVQADFFPEDETSSLHDVIEKNFMQMIFSKEAMPGMHINELEFSRDIGVATTSVREFLIRFSRFGLIEKRPNGRWILKGLTRQFALELANVRDMFELHSAQEFARLPKSHSAWKELDALEIEHRELLSAIDSRYPEFSPLDARFHMLIHSASNNRFIVDFHDVISMVFHYHYQWNRVTQKARNARAIAEHLDYIAALRSGDPETVAAACNTHLASARNTLLASVKD
jgi:DNA-binding GntR family transcriptional regulator